MIEKKDELKRILFSSPLVELNFYQVNDNFFEFPEDGYWIIDTGIELKFRDGIVSAAWSSELESYVIVNNSVKDIYGKDNLFQLENKNILNLRKFIGLNIIDANFKTLEFEYAVDYTMRIEKENRFVELVLEFENKTEFQIAFIDYELKVNKGPTDFSYDVSTDLLISTKKILKIKT